MSPKLWNPLHHNDPIEFHSTLCPTQRRGPFIDFTVVFPKLVGLVCLCALAMMAVSLAPTLGQTTPKHKGKAEGDKYRLHPTSLHSSPTGVYIPKDLPDTFTELDKMLSPALRTEMRTGTEKAMFRYHFGLGMWIRNNWGLWKGLRLAKWFNQYDIGVPDDMSGMIFVSYWRYLNHQPIAFQDQVKAKLAYWERAKVAAAKEKQRVMAAKSTIRAMMMDLQVAGTAKQMVTFPSKPLDDVRVRYMAPFAGGVLVTAKTFDGKVAPDDDFSTRCFFLDLTTMVLRPVRLPEMDRVMEAIVVEDHAYFHGLKQGRDVLLEIHAGKREGLPVPPGTGFLQLGTEQPGAADSHLLAIRSHTVARWNGQWQNLYQVKEPLPYGVLPPQQFSARLYFRDEGRNEDDKRLSWLEGSAPDAVTYFDEHVGVVGSEGPRWENVWSYAQTSDGKLWLSTGSIIGSSTLLNWNAQDGYHIALCNDATQFDGDLFGSEGDLRENTPNHALAVTGLEARPDNSLSVIGPHGLFSILDDRLTPLLRFRNTPNDWIPTHLLTLHANAFLVGGHFGGTYLFRKGTKGEYRVFSLERMSRAPKTL